MDLSEPGSTRGAVHPRSDTPRIGGLRPGRLWKPLAILCVSRVFTLGALYLTRSLTHRTPLLVGGWDVGWYVRAAEHGWPHRLTTGLGRIGPSTIAFFPGFPLLIRVVHALTPLGWSGAAALATFVAELAMVVAFWALAHDIWDDVVADRATVVFCFFPGAFIFSLSYSEPLLLAAAGACILALRRRHWVMAGCLGAVATATRPNGVALIACCAWEAWFAIRARREWVAVVSVPLAASGIVGWFAYLWASTGSPTAWYQVEQHGWREHQSVLAILTLIKGIARHGFSYPNQYVPVLSAAMALVLLVMLVHARAPGVLVVYTAIVLTMAVTSTALGLRPRFVLTAFPLAMVLGWRLRGELYGLVVGASATLMMGLLILTLTSKALVP